MGELSASGLKAKLTAHFRVPPNKAVRITAGSGLYLLIKPGQKPGTGAWVVRFTSGGKRRDMGLGVYPEVGLADARLAAFEARGSAAKGQDPILSRSRAKAAAAVVAGTTFKAVAEACYAAKKPTWKNPKHGAQWIGTLEKYVFPKLGPKPVATINSEDVLGVLKPIWAKIPETASRVRGRIESILSYAAATGLRPSGPNPGAWRGNLSEILGAPTKMQAAVRRAKGKGEHYPSLAHEDIPAFFVALEEKHGMSVLALRFAILLGARTGEVRKMKWSEVDLKKEIWVVPADRMKGHITHFVPLSPAALAILAELTRLKSGLDSLVFPGQKKGRPLSDMTLSMLVRGMATDGLLEGERPRWCDPEGHAVVPHGFRATFKSWTLSNGWPDHLSERALAHVDKDRVRAAYAREPLTEERRPMMDDWAKWCENKLRQQS